jgi:prepilin-type processing-associated H-X9-DG protein
MACDADGQTWLDAQGNPPSYPSKGWTRKPRIPNHPNGQNVMYFDGHVKWVETVYSSRDPNDNIFCPNSTNGNQWDPDTDAFLWDGVNARAVQEIK